MTQPNKTRETAAQLLSMAACNWDLLEAACSCLGHTGKDPSRRLAFDALSYVVRIAPWSRDAYAEAESLVRTGWLP